MISPRISPTGTERKCDNIMYDSRYDTDTSEVFDASVERTPIYGATFVCMCFSVCELVVFPSPCSAAALTYT